MIVTKFGGSSLANPEQMKKVEAIIEADPERKVVVVSAPGKDDYIPYKVTDLLYTVAGKDIIPVKKDEKGNVIQYMQPSDARQLLHNRFSQICKGFGFSELEGIIHTEIEGLSGQPRDFVASRGEYWNAQIMARVLGFPFFDAKDFMVMNPNGSGKPQLDLDASVNRIKKLIGKSFVFPGFYGDCDGQIATLSRGASDYTGSVQSLGLGARLYENWTDVNGLCYASPKIVKNPRTVQSLTFKESRELTYMGFEAFHDEAMFPLIIGNIPVRIKNTNNPDGEGTQISSEVRESDIPIAGVAGKPGFAYIEIEKYLLNQQKGFVMRALNILYDLDLNLEHPPSGIDNFAIILKDNEDFRQKKDELMRKLQEGLQPGLLKLHHNLALIALVGEGMRHRIGIAARATRALSRARVNIEVINQGPSETNIIFGVEEPDCERGVRALYNEFVRHPYLGLFKEYVLRTLI